MRTPLFLFVLSVVSLLPRLAHAGCTGSPNTFSCTDRESSYAACSAWIAEAMAQNPNPSRTCQWGNPTHFGSNSKGYESANTWLSGASGYSPYWIVSGSECPAGEQWSEEFHVCVSPAECLAHNAEPGFKDVGNIMTGALNKCVGGCEYKAMPGSVCTIAPNGQQVCSADMEFTGNVCGTGSPVQPIEEAASDKDKPQDCVGVPGQSVCVKPNGDQCYNASTGKQICWTPGETGEKTDGPVKQKRDGGNQPIPPNLNLPNGDTLQQTGQPTSTTTNVTNNNGTTIITTTTTNYTTTNGTNAGPTNSGEPGDGSGGSGEGDDGTSASGGGDCDTPPIVSGDAALNMVATQTWATRCAVEAGNAVNATGDIANCSQPFTVEGNNANALKLRAMRKQICPDAEAISDSDYLGDGSGEEDPSNYYTELGANFDGWDSSGFGFGQSCPALPVVSVFGNTYDLGGDGRNEAACNVAHLLAWLVLFVAGVACLRIVTEA